MGKLLCVAALIFASCADVAEFANVQPVVLHDAPLVSNYEDPEAQLGSYVTFSAFPYSLISDTERMNEIMEKQVLFFVRSQLEVKGYRFVRLNEQPDFLVTAQVSSQYSQSYVPPQQVSVPVWKPGRIITSQSNTSGTLTLNSFLDPSLNTWGNYSGSTTTSTYVPGYRTTETQTRPGYTVGYFYPAAAVWIYDRKSLENVWFGLGVGASDNPEARVASQFVISEVIAKLPDCSTLRQRPEGVVGIEFGVLTTDGNSFYPMVFNIPPPSPARKAGLHKFDVITSVDGTSLKNKSFADVQALFGGAAGSSIVLQVHRAGRPITLTLTRVDRTTLGW